MSRAWRDVIACMAEAIEIDEPAPNFSIDTIDIEDRVIVLVGGATVPIDTMFDSAGEETDDPKATAYFIAQMPDQTWITVSVSNLTAHAVH